MATNCSDFVDSIDGLLRAAGYVIHNGNAETGETVTDESGADWWFTWGTPQMSEYECGPTCSGSLEALQSAALHWFENARVPMHTSAKVEAQTAPTVVVDFSGGAIHAAPATDKGRSAGMTPIDTLLERIDALVGHCPGSEREIMAALVNHAEQWWQSRLAELDNEED